MRTVIFPTGTVEVRPTKSRKVRGARHNPTVISAAVDGSEARGKGNLAVVSRDSETDGDSRLPLEMTVLRKRAAWLVAEDQLSYEAIAEEIGVGVNTLTSWRRRKEFSEAVVEFERDIFEAIRRHGLAVTERRVQIAQEMLDRMVALVRARADRGQARVGRNGTVSLGGFSGAEPGEETGLLAEMPLKGGGTAMVFDAQLTKEIRETLKYASQELGQFQQRVDLTTGGGQPITFTISMADDGHEAKAIEGEWTVGGAEGRADETEEVG